MLVLAEGRCAGALLILLLTEVGAMHSSGDRLVCVSARAARGGLLSWLTVGSHLLTANHIADVADCTAHRRDITGAAAGVSTPCRVDIGARIQPTGSRSAVGTDGCG
jgi:hypothetical protein